MNLLADTRFGAYLQLAWFAGSRRHELRRPMLREQLLRQVYSAGVTALRRLGVPAADYLLLPRIFGLMIALPAVTACFQACALGSGWLTMAVLEGRPLAETAGRFLDLADPWLVLLSLFKSVLMGAAVGIIACHHGSTGKGSTQAISGTAIQAVGTGLVAVFVVDVAFAMLIYALK